MWYLGSFGELEKSLRMTGASAARPGSRQRSDVLKITFNLTLTLHASLVHACTANHHVVYYCEDDLATKVLAIPVSHSAVGQLSGFVKFYALSMFGFSHWQLIWMEKFPT